MEEVLCVQQCQQVVELSFGCAVVLVAQRLEQQWEGLFEVVAEEVEHPQGSVACLQARNLNALDGGGDDRLPVALDILQEGLLLYEHLHNVDVTAQVVGGVLLLLNLLQNDIEMRVQEQLRFLS